MARKSKRTRLTEGDTDAARYVTIQKVRQVDEHGNMEVRRIIEPLQDPRVEFKGKNQNHNIEDKHDEWEYHDNATMEPGASIQPSRKKTQKDYILQFVQRVDEFLGVLLTREALPNDEKKCQQCQSGSLAVWRCKDCTLGRTLCRKCIRSSHQHAPFHKIERWNGRHFRSAELCEVGSVIFVPHYEGTRLCNHLKLQEDHIENTERYKDKLEQEELRRGMAILGEEDGDPPTELDNGGEDGEKRMGGEANSTEALQDQRFFEYLDSIRETGSAEQFEEPDDEVEVGEGEDDGEGNGDGDGEPSSANYDNDPNPAAFYNTIRVVHTNGIHNIPLIMCTCRGIACVPLDLIASRLWPTSFIRVRTIFTAQVLDKFRLCNLEMNASAYQFYHLLRRVTSPMNPGGVVDLYNEFRRMSRLWRWTKKLKWAGYAGHNGKRVDEVAEGELANFCPACPQPGINLPNGWENDPNKFAYRRVLMADGNFKADHVQPKKPSQDVWLSEGSGMFPKREKYYSFLKTAIEKLTGAPCENTFRAITGAMQASKSCDVTGVVGVACARHGCYAPNSLVDLFKGEQQKNVDFALLAALKSTGVDTRQGLTFLYDVICQFFVHVKTRIGHLLPEGLDLDRAIGLFHVHAHKDECLFRFSPSFIPGAAKVIGEILESNWGRMNGVSPTARTATLAHRAEMLDDHATDSNHKKALDMPKTLCRRYVEAVETRDSTEKYFDEVSRVISPDLLELWTNQILDAERRRLTSPNVMDIYAAKGRGEDAENEPADSLQSDNPIQVYMQFALVVEEKEIEIRLSVRQLTRSPRHADPNKIEGLREKLRALLGELERLQSAAGIVEANHTEVHSAIDLLDWADERSGDEIGDVLPSEQLAEVIEDHKICLPSHGNASRNLVPYELKARIAQAKSHLYKLRNLIAEKSFQYSDVIRKAPRKGMRTRARAKVDDMNHQITFYSQLYMECRARLVLLGADDAVLQRFQVLKKEDVKTSTAVLDPNTPGSTRIRLSWIWHTSTQRLGPNIVAEDGHFRVANPESGNEDLDETDPATLTEFKRVHWLRARAQFHRWKEEAILLDYEMAWSVRFYMHKAQWWKNSASAISTNNRLDAIQRGRAAYANRQATLWETLARRSDYMFRMTNPYYKKNF